VGSPTPLSSHLTTNVTHPDAVPSVAERGDSWHTFPFIIFHIFTALVQVNVTAIMDSSTIGLQSDLHRLKAIRTEKEGKALSLTSARVPTCPSDRVSWHMAQYVENEDDSFARCKRNRKRLT
jgi:hypothetical protein